MRLAKVSLRSTRSAGPRPNFRLTYKLDSKTISPEVPTRAAIQKAGREVQGFRKFLQLTREFLGTNKETCRLRPLEEEAGKKLKKTVEALRQEITREVEQFLRVMFEDRRNTGRIDLEVTMVMRSALHWPGAAALSQPLQFPAPSRAGRTLRLLDAL